MAKNCCSIPLLVLVSQGDKKFVYHCKNCGTLVVQPRD